MTRCSTLVLVLAGLGIACATPPPAPVVKQPWPGTEQRSAGDAQGGGMSDSAVQAAAAARRDAEEISRLLDRDPKGWANRYPKAAQCEAAARAFRPSASERAWRALRACTTRTTPFKNLGRLTDGFWDDDLRSRSDAPIVLAAVIAARGGDLVNDLEALQRRRVPIFSLEIAKANPAMYRGRPVIFLSAIDNVSPTPGGRATARLVVVQMQGVGRKVVLYRSEYGSRRNDYNGQANYSGYDEVTTMKYDNQSEETDEIVLGRLPSIDPFFAPGRRFVVVGRFDGFTTPAATAEEPEPDKVPVISVYAYFEPGAQTALSIE